jgi:hypothetical protein
MFTFRRVRFINFRLSILQIVVISMIMFSCKEGVDSDPCSSFAKFKNSELTAYEVSFADMGDEAVQKKLNDPYYDYGQPFDVKKRLFENYLIIEFKVLRGNCYFECGNFERNQDKLILKIYSENCLKELVAKQYRFNIINDKISDVEIKMESSKCEFIKSGK